MLPWMPLVHDSPCLVSHALQSMRGTAVARGARGSVRIRSQSQLSSIMDSLACVEEELLRTDSKVAKCE